MNSQVFWLTYATLWVLMFVVCVLLVLVYRQVGLVYLGARRGIEHGGVAVGHRPPTIEVHGWAREELSWESQTRPTLAIFTLPGCSICDEISAEFPAVYDEWRDDVDFIWIEREGLEEIPDRFEADPGFAVISAGREGYAKWDVRGAPYAYLIGEEGKVLDRGLVNSAGEVAGLLRTRLGVPKPARSPVEA
jgi:thiol-disulfide isomerase/thioredoxin